MENNNNQNQGSISTQNMVIGIISIVAGVLLILHAYQTMLHLLFCGAGVFLVLFGFIKLGVIKSTQDLMCKVGGCMAFCMSKIKSFMSNSDDRSDQ